MTSHSKSSISLCLALLLFAAAGSSFAQRRSRHGHGKSTAKRDEDPGASQPWTSPVRLKLADGSRLPVDEAWESEQGFWYRQGGLTHLVSRERVKAIERMPAETEKVEADPVEVAPPVSTDTADGPSWIYLVGGARVEVDSATESPAGVWYRRGPMSVFIERSRVERVEREDVAKLAATDSKGRGWSTGNPKLDALIRQNGSRHGVDPYLIFLVMEQESHFNSRVTSPKGARGLMQLMPGTGARFGVRRPFDPAQNIAGGTRYLRQLLDQFKGRVDLVLASYNAGEGAVMKFGGKVPPYRETRDYVRKISYRYRRNKSPVTPRQTASAPAAPATGSASAAR